MAQRKETEGGGYSSVVAPAVLAAQAAAKVAASRAPVVTSVTRNNTPVVTAAPVTTAAPAAAPASAPVAAPAVVSSAPAYTPVRASLKGAAELAALYGGINYDEAAIRSKFDAATKAEYEALRKEYDITANQFYGQMYGTQNTAMDTIRKANAAAVATGASRGIQAANELSAILGLEQTNSQTATQLANDRNLLMDKEQAAYTKNVVDALNNANTTKLALGNLGANIYASDTQYDVGEMNYYAALNQAEKALAGAQYTADSNLAGTKYASDQNLAGTKYNADANVQSAGISAAATKAAASISAGATVKAAQIANEAQSKYYDYMKTQGTGNPTTDYEKSMNYLQKQYDDFMSKKDYDSAAIWYSKLTGLEYSKALDAIKNKSVVKADLQVISKQNTTPAGSPVISPMYTIPTLSKLQNTPKGKANPEAAAAVDIMSNYLNAKAYNMGSW